MINFLNDINFYLENPQEDLRIEYKDWLNLDQNNDRAQLIKSTIALSNSGGGLLIIGFSEQKDGSLHSSSRPQNIMKYTQDDINSKVKDFTSPKIHLKCEYVQMQKYPHNEHLIIKVEGDQSVPVMSTRNLGPKLKINKCYIRKSGPCSEAPDTENEWRTLFRKCVKNERDELILALKNAFDFDPMSTATNVANQDFQNFLKSCEERWDSLSKSKEANTDAKLMHGYYDMAFALNLSRNFEDHSQLEQRLKNSRNTHNTGYPAFSESSHQDLISYETDKFIEAWHGKDTSGCSSGIGHFSDFWRVSLTGNFFTRRAYREDFVDTMSPGKTFWILQPIWQLAETVEFIGRFAELSEANDEFVTYLKFTGIDGRTLSNQYLTVDLPLRRTGRGGVFTISQTQSLANVRDNPSLYCEKMLSGLYRRFDRAQFARQTYEAIVQEMRKSQTFPK